MCLLWGTNWVSKEQLVFLRSALQLLVTADVHISPIFTLMMKALRSSESSLLTGSTRRHIPKDAIHHSLLSFEVKRRQQNAVQFTDSRVTY
jgi:hypothetical protein